MRKPPNLWRLPLYIYITMLPGATDDSLNYDVYTAYARVLGRLKIVKRYDT